MTSPDKNLASHSRTLHIAPHGSDAVDGSEAHPFRRISDAAQEAVPGDTILVHEGLYRERIDPPCGGSSDAKRIRYEAAPGERVEIRGSEPITGWEPESVHIWRTSVPNTLFGDYHPYRERIRGDWFDDCGRPHHTGALYLDGEWLLEAASADELARADRSTLYWHAEVGETETVFRANFGEIDPNAALTEINVRPTVFYPSRNGIDFITLSGFILRHAATNWAPPTAEQVGLVGTNWSKGWIIENNTITHSRCTGLTLGKYGDEYDNTSADSATGYVATVERAAARGWNRETVGGHLVRNNTITHCEQAGIAGSLGAIFSEIRGNEVHHIHVRKQFTGHEQAGIKLHAPIDTLIAENHVHHCHRAFWMDWMTQGTRITRNLCHDSSEEDLFAEVNHGPFVVDHNLFLSPVSLRNWSQGGAYLHNLFAGEILPLAIHNRETPYLAPHSTETRGLANIAGGDDRLLNNIVAGEQALDTSTADRRDALTAEGKKAGGSQAFETRANNNPPLASPAVFDEESGQLRLTLSSPPEPCDPPTSDALGTTRVSAAPFREPSGGPLDCTVDFSGTRRSGGGDFCSGPFARSAWRDDELSLSLSESRQPSDA